MTDKRDILHGTPLMAGLAEPLVDELLAICQQRRLRDGEYIYRQGEEGDAMYGVLEGKIRLSNTTREGRELLVMLVERGDWIGEVSLFDGAARSQDAYALGDTEVLRIGKEQLDTLLEARPELYRYFVPMLCRKLRLALSYVETTALYPLSARLARRLLDLHQQSADSELHFPQEDLAKMLAVSRQALSRELKRLEAAGAVAVSYGKLRILNVDLLCSEAVAG
ncbi:MAG: Crp/Fnr family transcriptional regulator [Spongiibacter sp.]